MFILFMLAGCTNDKDITEIIPQSMDSSMETPNEVEQNDTVLQKEKIQSSPNMITEEQMQNVSEIYYAYFTLADGTIIKIAKHTERKKVDLVMFMGQSNMAGRGVAAQSVVVAQGHGYEFRAISDPTKLYPVVEPIFIPF